ncbi:MAG: protein kinase [Frankia sp.]|nr:protein kinase [Frankia sp.]
MPNGAGRVFSGRYRLQRAVAQGRLATVWRAVDDVLARPVAVKLLDNPAAVPETADADEGAARFIAAAVAAGRLSHPRIASVFDAAVEDGVPYVVSAWVDGDTLAALLRDGPLAAARATTIAAQSAEALVYAHARGVPHAALHAGNVLLASDGTVKLTDFQVDAVLRPPASGAVDERADVRALAAILYAALTGRSVRGAAALPPAPTRSGHLVSPRQIRAGVPRDLDSVVMRALAPRAGEIAILTARDLLSALAPLPGEWSGQPTGNRPTAGLQRRRRWLRIVAPLGVLAGVAVASWLAGLAVGRVPDGTNRFPALGTPSPSAGQSAAELTLAGVRDFDPPPGDGRELPATVRFSHDGDESTAWETTTYFTSTFGNLKPGVGLLVDLGRPVAVRKVGLVFSDPGVSVELRAADSAASRPDDFRTVATARDAGESVSMVPANQVPARYWLIWLTRLPPIGGGRYRAGVAELAFFG